MQFWVDGYNLMHAAGMARPGMKPGRLKGARGRFLDWIADTPGGRDPAATIQVVFDAQHAVGASAESLRRGLRVRFATGQTADDLIETLLLTETTPARVTVVSNDNRVREAARRRGAAGWGCEAFVDWLLSGGPVPGRRPIDPSAVPAEKPEGPVPDAEAADLLAAFTAPKPR